MVGRRKASDCSNIWMGLATRSENGQMVLNPEIHDPIHSEIQKKGNVQGRNNTAEKKKNPAV